MMHVRLLLMFTGFMFSAYSQRNDSVANYSMKTDTTTKLITLSTYKDTTFKCNLHYTNNNPDEYVFEGNYKNDSIRFVSRKINLTNLPLIKDRGKAIWFWWQTNIYMQ